VRVPDSVVKRSTDSETMTQPQTNKQTNNDKDNRFGNYIKYTSPIGAQSNISLTEQPVALKGNHHHLSMTVTMDDGTLMMNKFIFRNPMTR
jgi:hypothetical protein